MVHYIPISLKSKLYKLSNNSNRTQILEIFDTIPIQLCHPFETKWDLQNRLLFIGILFFCCSKTYNVTFVRHGIILKTNKKVFKRMLLSILLYWSLWINSRTKRKCIWCTTSVRKPSRLRLWIQFFSWWEYYEGSINNTSINLFSFLWNISISL